MVDPNSGEAIKYRKFKRAILVGVIIGIITLVANLYNYLMHRIEVERETKIEHDIYVLTQHLFAEDATPNRYLRHMNLQAKTTIYEKNDKNDKANESLLELHENLLTNDTNSTTYLMRRLFDNYNLDTHVVEHHTEQEQQEEVDFLTAVFKTKTMKYAIAFLAERGYMSPEPGEQMQLLYNLWFQQYTDIPWINGSCSGFEHVFLADLNKQSVIGLHNWIYFHDQEKNGKLDYKGYIEKIDLGKHGPHLLAVRFTFHNVSMSYNTLFVGTSPELELALYTVCFLMSMNKPCNIQSGHTNFTIVTHSWKLYGRNIISLAYPLIDAEFRPFPVKKKRTVEICQTTLKCQKCRKTKAMKKNVTCYN